MPPPAVTGVDECAPVDVVMAAPIPEPIAEVGRGIPEDTLDDGGGWGGGWPSIGGPPKGDPPPCPPPIPPSILVGGRAGGGGWVLPTPAVGPVARFGEFGPDTSEPRTLGRLKELLAEVGAERALPDPKLRPENYKK